MHIELDNNQIHGLSAIFPSSPPGISGPYTTTIPAAQHNLKVNDRVKDKDTNIQGTVVSISFYSHIEVRFDGLKGTTLYTNIQVNTYLDHVNQPQVLKSIPFSAISNFEIYRGPSIDKTDQKLVTCCSKSENINQYINFYDKKVTYCNCCGNTIK